MESVNTFRVIVPAHNRRTIARDHEAVGRNFENLCTGITELAMLASIKACLHGYLSRLSPCSCSLNIGLFSSKPFHSSENADGFILPVSRTTMKVHGLSRLHGRRGF